jgi:coenzyme F420-0:L-glutamate ligase
MKIKAIKTNIFKPNDNLISFIEKYFPSVSEKSILVITSKIVALAEGRLVKYIDEKNKAKIIKQESDSVIKTKYVYLTIKNGEAMANAGIDESNADGNLILLPKNSYITATKIRKYFCTKYKLKDLGVIITDSRCLPLRAGVVGVALGYSGFKGLKEYRGKTDIFKRPFVYERVDVVDSLATAAVLCMGEGNERMPLAIINDAPVEYTERMNKNELKIDIKEDLYGPLFRKIK